MFFFISYSNKEFIEREENFQEINIIKNVLIQLKNQFDKNQNYELFKNKLKKLINKINNSKNKDFIYENTILDFLQFLPKEMFEDFLSNISEDTLIIINDDFWLENINLFFYLDCPQFYKRFRNSILLKTCLDTNLIETENKINDAIISDDENLRFLEKFLSIFSKKKAKEIFKKLVLKNIFSPEIYNFTKKNFFNEEEIEKIFSNEELANIFLLEENIYNGEPLKIFQENIEYTNIKEVLNMSAQKAIKEKNYNFWENCYKINIFPNFNANIIKFFLKFLNNQNPIAEKILFKIGQKTRQIVFNDVLINFNEANSFSEIKIFEKTLWQDIFPYTEFKYSDFDIKKVEKESFFFIEENLIGISNSNLFWKGQESCLFYRKYAHTYGFFFKNNKLEKIKISGIENKEIFINNKKKFIYFQENMSNITNHIFIIKSSRGPFLIKFTSTICNEISKKANQQKNDLFIKPDIKDQSLDLPSSRFSQPAEAFFILEKNGIQTKVGNDIFFIPFLKKDLTSPIFPDICVSKNRNFLQIKELECFFIQKFFKINDEFKSEKINPKIIAKFYKNWKKVSTKIKNQDINFYFNDNFIIFSSSFLSKNNRSIIFQNEEIIGIFLKDRFTFLDTNMEKKDSIDKTIGKLELSPIIIGDKIFLLVKNINGILISKIEILKNYLIIDDEMEKIE